MRLGKVSIVPIECLIYGESIRLRLYNIIVVL